MPIYVFTSPLVELLPNCIPLLFTQYLYKIRFRKRCNLCCPLYTNQFLRGTICFWVKLYKTFILISQSSKIGIPQFDGSFSVQMIEG